MLCYYGLEVVDSMPFSFVGYEKQPVEVQLEHVW